MDSKARKFVGQIASGKAVSAAAGNLNAMIPMMRQPDKSFEASVSTEILASSSALTNLLSSAAGGDVEAKRLLFHLLLPVPGSAMGPGNSDPRNLLARTVIASDHCAAITTGFTTDLSQRDGHTRYRACMVLEALSSQPGSSSACRTAIEAGAFPKLIDLMMKPPHALVMPYPIMVIDYLCHASANRTRAAVKAGALRALAQLLDDPDNSDCARTTLSHMITTLPLPTSTPRINTKIINGFARELGTPGSGDWREHETKASALQVLYLIVKEQPAQLGSAVAEALLQHRALPGLVQAARLDANYYGMAAKLLAMLLQHPGIAAAAAGTQRQLAEAAAKAGILEAGMPHLLQPSEEHADMISGAMVMLQALAGHMDGDWLGAQVARLPTSSRSKVLSMVSERFGKVLEQTEDEAAGSSGCAKCGATSGSGKGGTLLQCSRCKQVHYCSPGCQRDDWRRHKQQCGSVPYLDHSGRSGPSSSEPFNNSWVNGSEPGSSSGASGSGASSKTSSVTA